MLSPYSTFESAQAALHALSLRRRPPEAVQIELGTALAGTFEQRSEFERERAVLTSSSVGNKLLSLSGYLAETAINRENDGLLYSALMLHVIEGFQKDYRENIRYLVLIAYAARRLGVPLSSVIAAVSAIGSPQARRCLEEFSHRPTDLNALASFGIREEDALDGFRFVPA